MAVDSDFIQTLKDKSDIVDIVRGYVSIERVGTNWWGCCPFHREKTPSFSVSSTQQFYHCFGCGQSGDVIKFVQQVENVEFMDAVRILADKAKIPVPESGYDEKKSEESKRLRQTVLAILNDTARFYLDNLNSGKAEEHISYIESRKIPRSVVKTFGLGASLGYEELPAYLSSKGYSDGDMLEAGVVYETSGRLLDSQAGRLIFPIINSYNEVIAFGGRLLHTQKNSAVPQAKYKNTKDTVVFNKRKTLYNINQLKKLRKDIDITDVIMVEGYMDTISLYQAGIKNVVASMGTSLTQDQARLLKRYSQSVLISYDGDSAGQDATIRGLEIFRQEGINVKVVELPEENDPDEVIKKFGADVYRDCLGNAVPLIDYKLKKANKGFNLNTTEGKRAYVQEALKVVRTSDSASEQEDLLRTLSKTTGITYESLNRDLGKAPPPSAPVKVVIPKKTERVDAVMKASRFVVASYLFDAKYVTGDPTEISYVHPLHSLIARHVKNAKEFFGRKPDVSGLFGMVEENTPEYDELNAVLEYNFGDQLTGDVAVKSFSDCIKTLDIRRLEDKMKSLLAMANATDIKEDRDRFLREIGTLRTQIQQLKNAKQEEL